MPHVIAVKIQPTPSQQTLHANKVDIAGLLSMWTRVTPELVRAVLSKSLCVAGTIIVLSACAMRSTNSLLQTASTYGFEKIEIATQQHTILGFVAQKSQQNYINVYLEGDGQPWISGIKKARNPTGKNHYALKLMRLDNAPSLYLSRPCYGYKEMPKICSNILWTSDRYSEAVVSSLNQALDQIKSRFNINYFNMVGFSGGGSLAVLVAARRNDIKAIVTIAANLDHRAWTQYFGYEPLSGSLNAVDYFPLDQQVDRWHLVGDADTNVPAPLVVAAARQDKGARVKLFADFDHRCCWHTIWPDFIRSLNKRAQ